MLAQFVHAQRTLLVVDDDNDTRHLTRIRLERAFPGITVLEAIDRQSAVPAASRQPIDAVITDHHLGTEEGAGMIAQLRQAGVRGPIVMFTGSSDPAVYERAYAAGAAHVFAGRDTDFVAYFRALFAK